MQYNIETKIKLNDFCDECEGRMVLIVDKVSVIYYIPYIYLYISKNCALYIFLATFIYFYCQILININITTH